MTQQPTSRAAYRKLDKEKMASEQTKILQVLAANPEQAFTDRLLSFTTELPRNIVWSRRNSLAEKNLIIKAGVIHDPVTGCDVQAWRIRT
jgi:hypothetical protein